MSTKNSPAISGTMVDGKFVSNNTPATPDANDSAKRPVVGVPMQENLHDAITADAKNRNMPEAAVIREILAAHYNVELEIVTRGRKSSMAGLTDAEKKAILAKRAAAKNLFGKLMLQQFRLTQSGKASPDQLAKISEAIAKLVKENPELLG